MAKLDLNGKSVLITGGTGSFGQECTKQILELFPKVKKLVVFSRDEYKQFEMAKLFPEKKYPMRYFLGDVRDKSRLVRAFYGIDVVIHAAALKHVPAAEYNPIEFVKTNIMGAQNIIEAAIDSGVQKVVALSTDKAAAPVNLYGATKLCSDKLFIAANNMSGGHDITFSVVRYGNVMGSRGSVIPFFLEEMEKGVLPITHKEMTRFNISLKEGVQLVLYALENAWGGEIFVPKIPSCKMTDVAEAVNPDCKIEYIGIRPGEKLHEEMITQSDAMYTLELDDYYVICPPFPLWDTNKFEEKFKARKVAADFRFNSATNKNFLSVEQIREQIRENIDSGFKV